MSSRSRAIFLPAVFLYLACFTSLANADSLSIVYTSPQNQTATVGPVFTPFDFAGYIVNNTNAPHHFSIYRRPRAF